MHLLFVYGSLKFGLSNHGRLGGGPCIDRDARSDGYRLVAGYPALVESPGSTARGEVYSVSDPTLRELDEFEECPLVYVRRKISVVLGSGVECEVFTYLASDESQVEPYSGDSWQPPAGLIPFESR
jgi:gamma-glutamylcyclotransferase (GGCT)/AIG2-like uncharacterized protein YtfP